MRTARCSGRLSCHGCPPPCTPPATHAPHHAQPLPRMPPHHAHPPWTDRHLWKYNLRKLRLRAVIILAQRISVRSAPRVTQTSLQYTLSIDIPSLCNGNEVRLRDAYNEFGYEHPVEKTRFLCINHLEQAIYFAHFRSLVTKSMLNWHLHHFSPFSSVHRRHIKCC